MAHRLPTVKHVIAMSSGKGGVGKSTAAVNVALALKALGMRVAVSDVDIFGPTIPVLLGLDSDDRPKVVGQTFQPIERLGIKVMSMGLVTDHDTPAIFRGPMISKFITQFILGVDWGDLDILILDLPPGTGDAQLSLSQIVLLSGAIVVTTPQQVSKNIALRGLRMFEKVRVPLLGVIENMSGWICESCGHETRIFKNSGGKQLAEETGVPFLGSIPMDPAIAEGGDAGRPIVDAAPESVAARAYMAIAAQLVYRLDEMGEVVAPITDFEWQFVDGAEGPGWHEERISEKADPTVCVGLRRGPGASLELLWADGVTHGLKFRKLRQVCPCALCVDEHTGELRLDPKSVRLDIAPELVSAVGQYAMAIHWNDGHHTGIYTYSSLRRLGEGAPA